MHVLGSSALRNFVTGLASVGLVYFCMSNFMWDIPFEDFRPFKKGENIAEQKRLEEDAAANVQVLKVILTNKADGKVTELDYNSYLSSFKDYPKEDWSVDYIQSEPTVEHTKISEFDLSDIEGESMASDILQAEEPLLLIIANQIYGDASPSTRIVKDTVYMRDTIYQKDGTISVSTSIKRIDERSEEYVDYLWKDFYVDRYKERVIPMIKAAKADNIPVYLAVGADHDQITDFTEDLDLNVIAGTSDDILLKTIVRSNPGVVLMDKGVLVDKWHYKQLPTYEVVKSLHLD